MGRATLRLEVVKKTAIWSGSVNANAVVGATRTLVYMLSSVGAVTRAANDVSPREAFTLA